MEVGAALFAVGAVETVGPVDTHHTHHGEEDADAGAGRAFHLEWVEIFDRGPCVTAFDESEGIDCGDRKSVV